MNDKDMLEAIRRSLCSGVEIEEKGLDRYIIHTEFTYPDGDELRIVLKTQDDLWVLTDEGHTMMWLSYEDLNLKTEVRSNLLSRTLKSNRAVIEEGRIIIRFKPDEIGNAVHSMIQVLIQVADLIYMDRENVRSTFVEDMRTTFLGQVKKEAVETNKEIESKRGDIITVDLYIKGDEPLLVFAVNNKEKCLEAILSIVTLSMEDEMQFTSMVVIDEEAEIPAKDRDRAINRADKTYIGLEEMGAGLVRFLTKHDYGAAIA